MEYCSLGTSGIQVSRLGFGGCPAGGHGWGGGVLETEAAIRAAMDAGVTLFDTADIYGLGQSETIFGEVLRPVRQRAVIATKFGVRRVDGRTVHDTRPAYIQEALEASLTRLKTDYVDLYQLHYWDGETPLADIQGTMADLIQAGKIRAWGVTNLDPLDLPRDMDGHMHGGPAPVSYSYQHNLVTPHDPAHLDRIHSTAQASFLAWGSLAQGALSGKYADDHSFGEDDRRARDVYSAFHGAGLGKRRALLAAMRDAQTRHSGRSLAQIAIRWILQDRPESIALAGIKTPKQLDGLAGAFGWSLEPGDMALLSALAARPAESFAPAETRSEDLVG
ncbi:MAG: aldo/keto reductase [Pseudomonadota bacterium]